MFDTLTCCSSGQAGQRNFTLLLGFCSQKFMHSQSDESQTNMLESESVNREDSEMSEETGSKDASVSAFCRA